MKHSPLANPTHSQGSLLVAPLSISQANRSITCPSHDTANSGNPATKADVQTEVSHILECVHPSQTVSLMSRLHATSIPPHRVCGLLPLFPMPTKWRVVNHPIFSVHTGLEVSALPSVAMLDQALCIGECFHPFYSDRLTGCIEIHGSTKAQIPSGLASLKPC